MTKLAICCNHSYPHVGGTEQITRQIAELMVKLYGYSVDVYSFSMRGKLSHEGVNYIPCPTSYNSFAGQIDKNGYDHVFIYSDCFRLWPDILRASEPRSRGKKISCSKSIALVGMNHMRGQRGDMRIWKMRDHHILPVTHSNVYIDYQICFNANMSPRVIPNGVYASEFDNNDVKFRTKYNIKTPKMIICVSNFFPGKGQEHLVKVLDSLREKRDDFTAVFISNSVNFPYARVLSNQVEHALAKAKYKSKFLVNLSREDVVGAFNQADVLAFPTQKEVAPVVTLEAMASLTPWVTLPVGNVPELEGGVMAAVRSYDSDGYAKWGDITYESFTKALDQILSHKEFADELAQKGRKQVEEKFNWEKIAPLYHELFQL